MEPARRDEVFGYLVKAETPELSGPFGLRRQSGLEAPPQVDMGHDIHSYPLRPIYDLNHSIEL